MLFVGSTVRVLERSNISTAADGYIGCELVAAATGGGTDGSEEPPESDKQGMIMITKL
jgi:hypothetical protein